MTGWKGASAECSSGEGAQVKGSDLSVQDGLSRIAPPHARANESRMSILLCGVLLLLFAVMGWLSAGTLTDDDIGRFLSARAAFEHPDKILGLWTRPLFMLLYAVPAQLGYGAVELTTAAVCALTCWLSIRSAARLGESHPLWAALFLAFQPMFLLLSFSALTEPLAALCLAASIERLLAKRLGASAAFASLIPLARLELLPILTILGLQYLALRSWRSIAVLPLGLLAWNVVGWLASGDPLFLIHHVFVEREREVEALGVWHYPAGFIHAVGPVVFFFAILGLVDSLRRRRYAVISISIVVVFLYYTWSASHSGSLQSAGYLRHLVTISPLVALVAVRGWNLWILEPPRVLATILACTLPLLTWLFLSKEMESGYAIGDRPEHLKFAIVSMLALLGLIPWLGRRLLTGAMFRRIVVGLVLVALAGYFFMKHGPIPLNEEHRLMHEVAEWIADEGLTDRPILCNHVAFHFFSGRDPNDEDRSPRLTAESLAAAPESSVVIWDGHYGHEIAGGVELHLIERDPELRVLRRFLSEDRSFFAVALQRISRPPAKPFAVVDRTYRHQGFGVKWALPDRSSWQLEVVDEGTTLVRGTLPLAREALRPTHGASQSTRGANPLEGGATDGVTAEQASPLSFELGATRFLREWQDTRTYGAILERDLRQRHGMNVLGATYVDTTDWLWIECRNTDADVLVGTTVSSGRESALHVVGTGAPGTLASLRTRMPELVRALAFEEPGLR